jgi:3-dehydroquinate dehydratase-2
LRISADEPTRNVRRVLSVSGPNLRLLGMREPRLYGKETLGEIHRRLASRATELGVTIDSQQSNHEGDLVDFIGSARGLYDGILLNAGAFTHSSIAILDALLAVEIPAVEVHLSNPEARESFRRRSLIARACVGKVSGFGGDSYLLGLEGLVRYLSR